MSYRQFTRSRSIHGRGLPYPVAEESSADDQSIAEGIQTDVFRMATFTCAFLLLVVTVGNSPTNVIKWFRQADEDNVYLRLLAAWTSVKSHHALFSPLLSVDPSWVQLTDRPEYMGIELPVSGERDKHLENVASYLAIRAAMVDAFKDDYDGSGAPAWISDRVRPYREEILQQFLESTLETYFKSYEESVQTSGRKRDIQLLVNWALDEDHSSRPANIAGHIYADALVALKEIIDKDIKDARVRYAVFQRALRSRIVYRLAEAPIPLTQAQAAKLEIVVQEEIDLMPEMRFP